MKKRTAAVLALLGVAGVLTGRTLKTGHKTSDYRPGQADPHLSEKLSRMVQVPTVSGPDITDPRRMEEFHAVLEELFPGVHAKLEKTEIDGNLLFHWKGKEDSRPVVLMSHQDVVPAEGVWTHPPFSGDIAEGKIWGRGAADTKCSLMAILEAADQLLEEGFVPDQDVWISSSCTEEWAGPGCSLLVDHLKKQGVKPFLVLDEGGAIITDPIAGIRGNFAMCGLFEKGKADVIFEAVSSGGHASAPGKDTPVDRLAAFVTDVKSHPYFRVQMGPEVKGMFETLAPYAPGPMRFLFSNLPVFGPLLEKVLPGMSAQAGAMLQTTVAFTTMEGSSAFNVIPETARIGANLRFIPHQPEAQSLALLEKIAKKHGLTMEVVHSSDCTPSADPDGEAFGLVKKTAAAVFPGLPVVPYVVTGATDAQFYQEICDSCLRFAPVIYGPEQMKGMHGIDETIEEACLPGAVNFYKELIRNNH